MPGTVGWTGSQDGKKKGIGVRKSLSKKMRFEVFKRDAFVCQYCGAHPPSVILHVDHIHPVSKGGGNDIDNLVTACEACNQGKSARVLGDVPQTLKDKAASVRESEEQLRGYHEVLEARRLRIENEAWDVAEVFDPGCSDRGFNKKDLSSIKVFVSKLGVYECLEAAERADAKRPNSYDMAFRYFCGICWNKIRDIGGIDVPF